VVPSLIHGSTPLTPSLAEKYSREPIAVRFPGELEAVLAAMFFTTPILPDMTAGLSGLQLVALADVGSKAEQLVACG
jgi:hypothetical protein